MGIFLDQVLFSSQVAAFKNSGTALAAEQAELDSSGVSSLATCMGYIDQHAKISALMSSLQVLIDKDSGDLIQIRRSITSTDFSVSKEIEKNVNGG